MEIRINGLTKVFPPNIQALSDIYLDIAEVVPAEQVKAMTTAELSDHARDVIAAALKEREGKA